MAQGESATQMTQPEMRETLIKIQDQQDQQLAYKDINNCYYYGATLTFYALILAGASLIEGVDVIFEFFGTICVANLSFLFPGGFYLVARKKFLDKSGTR